MCYLCNQTILFIFIIIDNIFTSNYYNSFYLFCKNFDFTSPNIINKGAAIHKEEYVPNIIPTNNVKLKLLRDSPPNRKIANKTNKTVSEVAKLRDKI